MKIVPRLKALFREEPVAEKPGRTSYSQSGEDIIIRFVFDMLKIKHPSYLDIGAHHPTYLSNTYLLYEEGSHGVCVEPDPGLSRHIKSVRKRDTVLSVGVAFDKSTEAELFIMDPATLNTFSKKEADVYQEYYSWVSLKRTIRVPLVSINDIIRDNFDNGGPNLVSIDTEGVDFEIVKSLDFNKNKSEMLCIETTTNTGANTLRKHIELVDYIKKQGYFIYADTFINTIFVRKDSWKATGNAKLEKYD